MKCWSWTDTEFKHFNIELKTTPDYNQITMGEMSTHFKINIAEKTKHFTYLANI